MARVVIRDRLPVDPVLDQVRCRDDRRALLAKFRCTTLRRACRPHHGGPFLAHSVTEGCTAPREYAIGRSYRFVENNVSVSHVTTSLSIKEALAAPADAKGTNRYHRSIALSPRLWLNRNCALQDQFIDQHCPHSPLVAAFTSSRICASCAWQS